MPAATAILVLGVHRSGTSALTQAIALCGAALPNHLLAAAPENARGFFEPADLVALHDQILGACGSAWDDAVPLDPDWFTTPAARAFHAPLDRAITQAFGTAPLFVVKDPRLCRLLPLWLPVLAARDIAPRIVLGLRHPLEVATSLQARNGWPLARGLMLWLSDFLAAERASRALPRQFLTFDQLCADAPATLDRLAAGLGLVWPVAPGGPAHAAFLAPSLRHHHTPPEATLPDAQRQCWQWGLAGATHATPPDPAPLDALSAGLAAAAATFGPTLRALEDSNRAQAKSLADLHAQHDAHVRRAAADLRAARAQTATLLARLHALLDTARPD